MIDDTLDLFDEKWAIADKIWSTVRVRRLFDSDAAARIEAKIDEVIRRANKGLMKPATVDWAPLRNKLVPFTRKSSFV
jgi:alkylated DNA repair protein alkB family protein 5